MSDIDDELNILITGDTSVGRNFVANVIAEALEDNGFGEVKMVNVVDEPVEKGDVPTLLDLINENRPDLFSKTVTVKTRPAPGETDDFTTGDSELQAPDDTLADVDIPE